MVAVMVARKQFRHEANGAPRLPTGLVGFHSRVLYVSVTKAASTSMKTMLGEAESRFNPPTLPFTPLSSGYFADFIHSPAVHGLRPYRDLSFRQKKITLNSQDWWRVAVVRDPYDRLVSTWQNRVVMLGSGLPAEIRRHLQFSFDNSGCIDISSSFEAFVRSVAANRKSFFIDDHFRPQAAAVKPSMISYTHLLRLGSSDSLDEFRVALSKRVGKEIPLISHNEGLGLRTEDLVTQSLATVIEDIYAQDFSLFNYPARSFPAIATREPFTVEATRLALYLHDVVADREARRGARYALRELRARVTGTNTGTL